MLWSNQTCGQWASLRQMLCWQVLTAMEMKFKNGKYSTLHVKGVLNFDTESVPVQQFQARCA